MTTSFRAVALVALASCSQSTPTPGEPSRPVPRPVTPLTTEPGHVDEWHVIVAEAVRDWNTALLLKGCAPPFTVSGYGYPILLIGDADWTEDERYCGLHRRHQIVVRTGCANRAVVLHELGHALGVAVGGEHAPVASGAIMSAWVDADRRLTEWDVAAAACALGCGPCTGGE